MSSKGTYVKYCINFNMLLSFPQKSYSMPIGIEFQRRYATIVLDLEQLNKDLNKVLHKVQQYCYEVRFCWNLYEFVISA